MQALQIDKSGISFALAKFGQIPKVYYGEDDYMSDEWQTKMRNEFSSCDYWGYVLKGLFSSSCLSALCIGTAAIVQDFLMWLGFLLVFGSIAPGTGATVVIIFAIAAAFIGLAIGIQKGATVMAVATEKVKAIKSFKQTIYDKVCVRVTFK